MVNPTVALLAVLHDATEAGAPHVDELRGQLECDFELGRRSKWIRLRWDARHGAPRGISPLDAFESTHLGRGVHRWTVRPYRCEEGESIERRDTLRASSGTIAIPPRHGKTAHVRAFIEHAIPLGRVEAHGAGLYSAIAPPLRFTAAGQVATLTWDGEQWRGSGGAPTRPANNGRSARQERAHQKRRKRSRR